MAPPMKDLPRWLEENPEFAVAPDWTDIVKQSVSETLIPCFTLDYSTGCVNFCRQALMIKSFIS